MLHTYFTLFTWHCPNHTGHPSSEIRPSFTFQIIDRSFSKKLYIYFFIPHIHLIGRTLNSMSLYLLNLSFSLYSYNPQFHILHKPIGFFMSILQVGKLSVLFIFFTLRRSHDQKHRFPKGKTVTASLTKL